MNCIWFSFLIEVVAAALGDEVVSALNMAPATPAWLDAIGAAPMKLGLDLRGGVHFLMEVDMKTAMDKNINDLVQNLNEFRKSIKGDFEQKVEIMNEMTKEFIKKK